MDLSWLTSENIKNLFLSTAGLLFTLGSMIFYGKIYFNTRKIKGINVKIERIQSELDKIEIDNIMDPLTEASEIFTRASDPRERIKKKMLEQNINKLEREKNNLLEEISIYKIFNKK